MQLSDQQQRDLLAFLQRSWPETAACPVCRQNDWAVRSRVFELGEYRETAGRSPQRAGALPVVALTCETCGYVVLLDAVKAGVTKEPIKG